jgi:hypothetical protein
MGANLFIQTCRIWALATGPERILESYIRALPSGILYHRYGLVKAIGGFVVDHKNISAKSSVAPQMLASIHIYS